jgi:hypothetical protein
VVSYFGGPAAKTSFAYRHAHKLKAMSGMQLLAVAPELGNVEQWKDRQAAL